MPDAAHMQAALRLARRGLGNTWPNPAVGCVLVAPDGAVIGRGWTQPGGRPHAETEALARARAAGHSTEGATAYVTLEPCSHWGRTPPCCEALIGAGIARVLVATGDPDPRVDGRGLQRLRAAGVTVETGLLAAEAQALLAGFARRITQGRPLLTLKLATSLDGRIATAAGESKWITGPEARREAHALRARHDAILVGSGTVLADDPDLTCRIPGMARAPIVRVVADGRLRTPPEARLVRTARVAPTLLATRTGHPPARLAPYLEAGVEVLPLASGPAGLDPAALMAALAARGVTRVLAEGGAAVAAALLRGELVDRLAWFHAPRLLGGDGRAAIDPLAAQENPLPLVLLSAMPSFHRTAARALGPDLLTEYERAPSDQADGEAPCSPAS